MFRLDDKYMTLITALVLILAIGAIVHRSGGDDGIFSTAYVAKDDAFQLRAGRTQMMDVLLNDLNTQNVKTAEMKITTPPTCGAARIEAGEIEYSDSSSCEGEVTLAYCVPFEQACEPAIVTLTILNLGAPQERIATAPAVETPQAAPASTETATATPVTEPPVEVAAAKPDEVAEDGAPSPAPLVFDQIAQGEAPQPLPQVTMQPTQLSTPDTSEVITPSEAAANLRARPGSTAPNPAAGDAESGFAVSSESAQSAPVNTSGVDMVAPSVDANSNDITIALATGSTSPDGSSSPAGLAAEEGVIIGDAPAVAQIEAPTELQPAETEASGILASLARSNAFLGATVSAAKALLAPDEQPETASGSDHVTAPSPVQSSVADLATLEAQSADSAAAGLQAAGVEGGPVLSQTPTIEAALTPTESFTADATATPPVKAPVEAPIVFLEQPVIVIRPLEETEVATLTPAPAPAPLVVQPAAQPTTTLGGEACNLKLSLTAQSGAEVASVLTAPCHQNQIFTITHGALSFAAMTDATGSAEFVVPALTASADIKIQFLDGVSIEDQVSVSDIGRVTRVAIAWTAPIDLDLHAMEFGAAVGSEGHVWSGNPGSYREARSSGGGYLMSLGLDQGDDLPKAEVYTILAGSRSSREGLIDFNLEVADPGEACSSKVIVHSMRAENAELLSDRDIQLSLGACGNSTKMIVGNAIRDIRVGRN